jgi:hypothetical protein
MAAEPPHTAPRYPHTGCETICPQTHPITPPPDNDICPQNPLRQLLKERVMAQYQGYQIGISLLPSLAQLVTPWHPHTDVSLPTVVSPTPEEPTLSATPPRAREVSHLHIQTNKR